MKLDLARTIIKNVSSSLEAYNPELEIQQRGDKIIEVAAKDNSEVLDDLRAKFIELDKRIKAEKAAAAPSEKELEKEKRRQEYLKKIGAQQDTQNTLIRELQEEAAEDVGLAPEDDPEQQRPNTKRKPKIVPVTPEEKKAVLLPLFELLERGDTTPNKEYMQFIILNYSKGGWGAKVEDIQSTIADSIQKLHTAKLKGLKKGEEANIHRFKSFGQLLDFTDGFEITGEEVKEKDRGQFEQIFANDEVTIYHPKDITASKYFGMYTRWCTAGDNGNMFNSYNNRGPLYIFWPRNPKKDIMYNGKKFVERYQIHFESNNYMDVIDSPVPLHFLLLSRFGDLSQVFKDTLPENYQQYIAYCPDEKLKPITDALTDIVVKYMEEEHPDAGIPRKVLEFRPFKARQNAIDMYNNPQKYNLAKESGPDKKVYGPLVSLKYLEYTYIIQLNDQGVRSQLGEYADEIIDFVQNNIIMRKINDTTYMPIEVR